MWKIIITIVSKKCIFADTHMAFVFNKGQHVPRRYVVITLKTTANVIFLLQNAVIKTNYLNKIFWPSLFLFNSYCDFWNSVMSYARCQQLLAARKIDCQKFTECTCTNNIPEVANDVISVRIPSMCYVLKLPFQTVSEKSAAIHFVTLGGHRRGPNEIGYYCTR